MSVKVVLENALAQLETQKAAVYKQAYDVKTTELNNEFEAYRVEKKQEYDDAIVALRTRYEAAIDAKKAEIDSKAKAYADVASASVDKNIADIKAMIERTEG
jgi:hypothetical protein